MPFTMQDVPSRFLQPLFIDTNITYDLDMSKFPGLDDPQHMYQPALLIATDWSDYVYGHCDAKRVTGDAVIKLNESTRFQQNGPSPTESPFRLLSGPGCCGPLDSDTYKVMLDDVIKDAALSSHVFDFVDTDPDACKSDLTDITGVLTEGIFGEADVSGDNQKYANDRKRNRPCDSEFGISANKKSKMVDRSLDRLPSRLSVCLTSRSLESNRGS
ncbi:uncharacterized protein [Haliotis cracherodii]|uniref:uncharacterized protein n=1 Tax=Haliotis cracherodii TaxID=6455 RepID=UPI0039E9BC90